jgi:primary-amine oxidase
MLDGIKNSIEESDLILLPASEENPYGNQFLEEEILLKTEKEAIRNSDFSKSRTWIIHNEESQNYLGIARGYELDPYPTPLIYNSSSRISKRGIYILNNLYVTKYRESELYVMGKNVVEEPKDTGLEKYIENDENIVDEDIVVWYTCGFAHSPKCEDFPVMPREPLGFSLKPHNFFNENLGLYLQKNI